MLNNCSNECLRNAESLMEDANILLERKKFSSAQSLSITALEEVGKAIILELVDLNYYDKILAKKSIYSHKSKKAIIKAIENGMVLIDQINRAPEDVSITQEKMKELGEKLLSEMNSLENNRLNGLYVEIDIETGRIISSPKDCSENDATSSVEEAKKYVLLGRVLCDVFREIKACKGAVNNLRIQFPSEESYDLWKSITRKRDRTLTISFDES
jgi:AbiV family abortive infection protein